MTTINASNFLYVQFCHALIKECKRQGLPEPVRADTETGLPQNEGWAFLRFTPDGAALIIPKGKTRLGNLHSHVDLSGKDGYIPLPKKNGKVVCHFSPDLGKVSKVLSAFVGAAKRATLSPTPKATLGAPVYTGPDVFALDSEVASQDDYGTKELASWADSEEVDAETEAVLKAI